MPTADSPGAEATNMRALSFIVAAAALAVGSASGAVPVLVSHVVINEILPNPAGSDDGTEAFELLNPGLEPVDVSGWFVNDGDWCFGAPGHYELPAGSILPPGGILAFTIPREAHICMSNSFGDDLTLYDPIGNAVDAVWYGNGGDYFAFEDRAVDLPFSGKSAARCLLVDNAGGPNLDNDNPRQEFYLEASPSLGGANKPCGVALPAP